MSSAVLPAPDLLAPWGEPTPRVRVRDALRRLVAGGGWPFPSWTVLQNRLLDEVGSDLRPLVGLLVRAGDGGVVEQLPTRREGWPAARGALVVSLTAHTFIQPDMARWAVECWGYAFGLTEEAELTVAADARVALWRDAEARAARAREEAERRAALAAAAAAAAIPPGGGVSLGAGRPAAAGRAPAAPPAARATPVAGPARVAIASAPSGATPRVTPGSAPARPYAPTPPKRRGPLPEGLNNPVAALSLAGIVAFVGYVVYGATRLPSARANEVPRDLPVAPAAAAQGAVPNSAPNAVAWPGIPGVTAIGLPQTAADSARMIRVVPARRAAYATEQGAPFRAVARVPTPAPPSTAASGTATVAVPQAPPVAPRVVTVPAVPDGYDRLRLRSGRVLRGRVELVRASTVVFRDDDSNLRYEYAKTDVEAVYTEFGTTVRFSSEEPAAGGRAQASVVERAAARLVRRGLGGRYDVTFSVVSVTGSPECQRGARTAPPPDRARVTHVPGADTLAVTFEGGSTFASVVDAEARFASTFVIVPDQAYSGSALTTRLSGQFAEGGFDAAVNLVGYRRVRDGRDVACHTVLRAAGRKVGG